MAMAEQIEIDNKEEGIRRAFELSKHRWSRKTLEAYKPACDDFAEFCLSQRVPALPTSPETVVAFLRARESTHSLTALSQRLTVIRALHADAKERLPKGDPDRERYTFDDQKIADAWRDIKRNADDRAPRDAIRSEELRLILEQIPNDPKGIQDRAILCIGLAYALRRSEIVALDWNDLEISDAAMTIRIGRGERGQGPGYWTRTVARTLTETCPVAAMERWLEASEISVGPIFTSSRGNRMEGRYAASILKQYGEKAGFDPKVLGAQSLRSGHILERKDAGSHHRVIMEFVRIKAESYVEYLDTKVARQNNSSSDEENDIAEITADQTLNETQKKTLIDARRGQGKFRSELCKRWNDACAVTGLRIMDVLRASHIQAWKLSTNEDRLDPANGLLLEANLDSLFDKHLISFQDDGQMLIAASINDEQRRLLRLPGRLRKPLNSDEKRFLAKHRATGGLPPSTE